MNHDPSGAQSKLQVCDVCGAYLSRLDNDRRLADHFAGKVISLLHQLWSNVVDAYGIPDNENRTEENGRCVGKRKYPETRNATTNGRKTRRL